MYVITKPSGETITTEKANYIKAHKNGCFVLCERKDAEGVAHGGTPYLFADGCNIHEVDGGKELDSQMTAINGIIKTMLEG